MKIYSTSYKSITEAFQCYGIEMDDLSQEFLQKIFYSQRMVVINDEIIYEITVSTIECNNIRFGSSLFRDKIN